MATKYEELLQKIAEMEKQLSTCIGDECKAIESKIMDLKSNIPVIDRDELISDIVDEIEKRGTFGKEPKKIEDPEILCPSCGEKLTGNEEKCPSCSVELEWVD